jgi:acetyltransferase-like isoleucine patch superfamily enzyme
MGGVGWCYLRLHGVECGKGLRMHSLPLCRRHPNATIRIGEATVINNLLRENPAGISHRTVLVASGPHARLDIGCHVGISGAILFCTSEITIGDYVNIGVGARIYDTDFHPLDFLSRRANLPSEIKSAPVRICEDVFIGANVLILKGVTIGPRTIIGASSVVTRSLPPDVIAAGNPARIIRDIGTMSES